jgi:hypothetical protein
MSRRRFYGTPVLSLFFFIMLSCGNGNSSNDDRLVVPDITSTELVNKTAYIVSQCYTKTSDGSDVYNPCFTCHKKSVRPNYFNDYDLQQSFAMPERALKNPWTNLFKDRTEEINAISDDEIKTYVDTDNYLDTDGSIIITKKLNNVPLGWDADKDGNWSGYKPDCYFNFDTEGFDKGPDGSYTGWRAFAYYPVMGTFWPTNGSTDDVLIRLDAPFREESPGNFSLEIYKINLAIVEAMIKEKDVTIDSVDETLYGVDLDKNGSLGTATEIRYEWDPVNDKNMYYVGRAKELLASGDIHIAARLYPEGTEFLHSVRYISTAGNKIGIARRMKELRYGKKMEWFNYNALFNDAENEAFENLHNPDSITEYLGDMEYGVSNKQGWAYQGFIEDKNGDLRPQSYEETQFCMGCHAKLGTTVDNTFVFVRKFDSATAFQRGWYHWTQKDLSGVAELQVEQEDVGDQYEYSFYLTQNKAGDEFRGNTEVIDKFFNTDGTPKVAVFDQLHLDVTVLLNPSVERALKLNKAYRTIVMEGSYIYGRDPVSEPAVNVHEEVVQDDPTGIIDPIFLMGF